MSKYKCTIGIIFMVFVSSCSIHQKDNRLINMGRITEDGKMFIQWNEKKYEFFWPLSFTLVPIQGKQIGIVDGDKNDKICEVKGYLPEEWLINYYDVIMTTYNLFKEINVENIPKDLLKYKNAHLPIEER